MKSEDYKKLNEDIKKSLNSTQDSIDELNKYIDEFNNEQPKKPIYRDNAENVFIAKGKKREKKIIEMGKVVFLVG